MNFWFARLTAKSSLVHVEKKTIWKIVLRLHWPSEMGAYFTSANCRSFPLKPHLIHIKIAFSNKLWRIFITYQLNSMRLRLGERLNKQISQSNWLVHASQNWNEIFRRLWIEISKKFGNSSNFYRLSPFIRMKWMRRIYV